MRKMFKPGSRSRFWLHVVIVTAVLGTLSRLWFSAWPLLPRLAVDIPIVFVLGAALYAIEQRQR